MNPTRYSAREILNGSLLALGVKPIAPDPAVVEQPSDQPSDPGSGPPAAAQLTGSPDAAR